VLLSSKLAGSSSYGGSTFDLYVPTIYFFLKRIWVAAKGYLQGNSNEDGYTDAPLAKRTWW
jgi:hypothetical protein